MSRILADLKAFGVQYLRSPVGAFFALAFPIILILIFGSVFSQTESTVVSLPVQNLDGGNYSFQFITILEGTGSVETSEIPTDIEMEDYIRDHSLSFALQIPEGFSEYVYTFLYEPWNLTGNGNVTLYGDPSQATYGVAAGAVSAAGTIMNYQEQNAASIVGMQVQSVVAEEFEYIDFFLPGMIAFTVMTNALFAQSSTSAEYKARGYFKLLGTTPLAKWEWVLAKFLWYVVIMFASIALMFLISVGAFGVHVTLTPSAIAIILAGILLFVSMGLLIGTAAKGVESSAAVAQAIGFPMMFLSGTFFPIEMMPGYLQVVAYVLPLTYMSEGLRSTMIYGNEVGALINLAILLVLGIIFYVVASKLMRWKEK